MTSTIVAQFRDDSGYLDALSPTVNVWKADGTAIVTGAAMSFFGSDGLYTYDATTDEATQYIWQADGGVSLDFLYRYAANSFTTGYTTSGALTPAQDTALTTIYKLIRPIFHSILKLCAKFNIDLSKLGININEYK